MISGIVGRCLKKVSRTCLNDKIERYRKLGFHSRMYLLHMNLRLQSWYMAADFALRCTNAIISHLTNTERDWFGGTEDATLCALRCPLGLHRSEHRFDLIGE